MTNENMQAQFAEQQEETDQIRTAADSLASARK